MVAPSSWEIKTANNSDGRPRPSRSTISSSFRLPVLENRRERLIDAISLIRHLQTRHSPEWIGPYRRPEFEAQWAPMGLLVGRGRFYGQKEAGIENRTALNWS